MIKNQVPELHEEDLSKIRLHPLIEKLRKHPDANFCEYGFFTTTDTNRLFYRFWRQHQDLKKAENKSRNLIIFWHGMAGTTEYWQLLADRIIKSCDLLGFDLRSHGYSGNFGGIRGDISDFGLYVRDSEEFLDWLVKEKDIFNCYRSVFLLGESMGTVVLGNLILNGILNRYKDKNHDFSGIIYFAPAFAPKVTKISFKDIYTNIVNVLLFPFTIGKKSSLRVYTRGREDRGAWDTIHQEYDRTDPLHLDYISLRYMLQIKKGFDKIKRIGGNVITTPLIMIFGEKDEVVEQSVSIKYAKTVATKDLTIWEIPNGKHALFTDQYFEEYWDKFLNWIDERAKLK